MPQPSMIPTRRLVQGPPFQVTQEEGAEQNPSSEASLGRDEAALACRTTRMDLWIVPNPKASAAIFKEKLSISHGKQLDFYRFKPNLTCGIAGTTTLPTDAQKQA